MRDSLSVLGAGIKKHRREQKITLQELAEKTGLSAGLLSKIENFRTIPSLPVLLTIVAALKIDPGELFRELRAPEKSKWVLIRPPDRKPVEREEGRKLGYELILETPLPAGSSMQLMFVRVPPGPGGEPVTNDADQLIFMLSGEIIYRIDGELVRIQAGDTLFFDGRLPHVTETNPGEESTNITFYFFQPSE